jgi:CheY-like chemotaxis protein
MSRKILLIEADARLAGELAASLEEAGFQVRVTGDGKEGFEAAHDYAPDAIVLAAELPGTSGYLVCQKLKKDESLKSVPLVLTSGEATAETFEKHKQLKVRAQAYLLKPYSPEDLIDRLGELVGLPGADTRGADEEVVSLEEEMGLEALGGPPEDLPAFDLGSLPDEPAVDEGAVAAGGDDEDLRLLDDAFDGLASPGAPPGDEPGDEPGEAMDEAMGDRPVSGDELDAAAATLPDEGEPQAREDIDALEDEADRALGALTADDDAGQPEPAPDPRSLRTTIRGASADLLRAAGIPVVSDAPPRRPAPPDEGDRARAAADEEIRGLRQRVEELARKLDEAGLAAEEARAERRKAETDLAAAEERARAAEAEAAEARRGAEEAAEAISRAEGLRTRVEELEAEVETARREAEEARGQVDRRTAEIRVRLQEIEAAASKNEERVLKAYQKIKGDERLREKVRKALAIALQLLDEGAPAESPAEKKIGSALGRD